MERRWNSRKAMQLNITLEIPSSSNPVGAHLLDISLGGAFIETQATLSNSTPLIIALKLPGTRLQKSFRLYARVVRRTQKGVAVAFLPMPTDVIHALNGALFQEQQPANESLPAPGYKH